MSIDWKYYLLVIACIATWYLSTHEQTRHLLSDMITLKTIEAVNQTPKCPNGYVCSPKPLDITPAVPAE